MVFNIDYLKNFLLNDNTYGFVAKDKDKIAGFAYGYTLLRPDGKDMFITDKGNPRACHVYKKLGGKNNYEDEIVYVFQ